MLTQFLSKHKRTILYGAVMAVLLFVLKWLQFRLVIIDHSFEIYVGTIALIFTLLGIWLALRLTKPRTETILVERIVSEEFNMNAEEAQKMGLTKRELEVLDHMAKGLSNQEIAEKMFLSVSTIKTHSKNLFDKMGVVRRTQAIDKGKRLRII